MFNSVRGCLLLLGSILVLGCESREDKYIRLKEDKAALEAEWDECNEIMSYSGPPRFIPRGDGEKGKIDQWYLEFTDEEFTSDSLRERFNEASSRQYEIDLEIEKLNKMIDAMEKT